LLAAFTLAGAAHAWAAGAGLAASSGGETRTDGRNKPVIFVHGLNRSDDAGSNCAGDFGEMEGAFRDFGHPGPLATVAYYRYDRDCDHWIAHHGKHDKHYGGAAEHNNEGHHGADTDIRHLGYHMAWYLWRHFSSEGRRVDVVGHSMGGLITRYAIAQTEHDHERFPPYLLVEDVVTLGTPHGGARWYSVGCRYEQCGQMRAGSGFLVWLEDNAWEPDGRGGTDWSTFGSDDDFAVAADRAAATGHERDPHHAYMGSCHKVWYQERSDIGHSDFLTERTGEGAREPTADVDRFSCGGGWVEDPTSHWPVRRTDLALTFGNR